MEPTLPLTKRIANVLQQKKAKKQRKAQLEDHQQMMKPKVNPAIKMLDHLYELLSDDDSVSAMDVVFELTKHLGFEEEVAFEVPEEREVDLHSQELHAPDHKSAPPEESSEEAPEESHDEEESP